MWNPYFAPRECQAPVIGAVYDFAVSQVTACPDCGFDLRAREVNTFCPDCGSDLPEKLLAHCRECGDTVPPRQGFVVEDGVLCFPCVELMWLFQRMGRLEFFSVLVKDSKRQSESSRAPRMEGIVSKE